jgi:hypothetical protein
MNLSKPTNSLQSNIMHAAVNGAPAPTVGMGVTILMWTDRRVGTIVEVVSDSEVIFTEDDTVADKTKDCPMGHQNWINTPKPDGFRQTAKKGKDGKWYIPHRTPTGRMSVNKSCQPVAVGFKHYYHDWSF